MAKRSAGEDLTKETLGEGDDNEVGPGTFNQASQAAIATRKIRKPRSSNISSIANTPKTSGFAGFSFGSSHAPATNPTPGIAANAGGFADPIKPAEPPQFSFGTTPVPSSVKQTTSSKFNFGSAAIPTNINQSPNPSTVSPPTPQFQFGQASKTFSFGTETTAPKPIEPFTFNKPDDKPKFLFAGIGLTPKADEAPKIGFNSPSTKVIKETIATENADKIKKLAIELKSLNAELSKEVNQRLSVNSLCNLSPLFKEYGEMRDKILKEHDDVVKDALNSKTSPGSKTSPAIPPSTTSFMPAPKYQTETQSNPVVPIPPQTASETTTDEGDEKYDDEQVALMVGEGEEDENNTYETVCKVLEKKDKAFVDIGKGMLKIKTHKQTGKSRILVRADGSGRILLNISIFDKMNLIKQGDSRVTLSGSTDGNSFNVYSIKCKKNENQKLIDAINNAKNK